MCDLQTYLVLKGGQHVCQEFLLDFFSKEIGAYHYNRGLQDARILIEENAQNITQTFYEMEKPIEFIK